MNYTLPQILAATQLIYPYRHVSIVITQYPILNLAIDSIFNPTRETLIGSFEIDNFTQSAGYHLMQKVERLGKQPLSSVVKTMGYQLPCKIIIHAVFPDCRYKLPNPKSFKQCVSKGLSLANFHNSTSIAFPECGLNVLEWPENEAIDLLSNEFFRWIQQNTDSNIKYIILCVTSRPLQDKFSAKIQGLKMAFEGIEAFTAQDLLLSGLKQ